MSYATPLRNPSVGLAWLAVQKVLVVLLGVIAGGVVSRHLGPNDAGVLASAQAMAGLFGIFAMGVDSTVFMDELHHGTRGENAVMGGTTAVLALMGLFSWLLLIAYLWAFERESWVFAGTALVAGARLLVTFPAPVALWFQSRLMMREIVIPNTFGSIVLRAWQVGASFMGWGTIKIAMGEVLSLLCIMVASLRSYQRLGKSLFHWKLDWQAGFRVMARSVPAMMAAVLTTLLSRMDVLMVRALRSEDVAGIYSAASSLTESLLFVGGMITSVFVPLLLEKKARDRQGYERLRLEHLRFCTFSGWMLAFGLSLFSSFVIRLIFGTAFESAAGVLSVHAFLLVPCLAGAAIQSHLTMERKLRYLTVNLLLALLCNAGLNYLLIPHYGARGAAGASLVAATIAYVLVPLMAKETRALGKDVIRALLWPIPRLAVLTHL